MRQNGKHRVMTGIALSLMLMILLVAPVSADVPAQPGRDTIVATFSIVGCDPATGELGVAVASKFFTVGNVVPWAKAGVGAVATQAYANTSFGWRGLEMLEKGMTPAEVRDSLLRSDNDPERRQIGIVAADGKSVTYTGSGCSAWAGGRAGATYAVQGNILAGEKVVAELERVFVETEGTLADRLYAALVAGEAAGGDSRGKQSAALLVVKEGAGYGGYTDRAIDIRVDDSPEPFEELGRILKIAQLNYMWNQAWTLFTEKKYAEALPIIERASQIAPDNGELWYDVAVIRAALHQTSTAADALLKAVELNPKLAASAAKDEDLVVLRDNETFKKITSQVHE